MKELIDIYKMHEISIQTRIKLIKKVGYLINYKYASNITESLQIELIELLDENYDFSNDSSLKDFYKKD